MYWSELCVCLVSYPKAAKVMAVLRNNKPHTLTALNYLLLQRLATYCSARSTSFEDFERRYRATFRVVSQPLPKQAPPAAASPATHLPAKQTPNLPPAAYDPLPKILHAEASGEQQLAPLVGPKELNPPQPANAHPPDKSLTPSKS